MKASVSETERPSVRLRNQLILLFNMSFFSLGYNIISPITIMPVFVSYLTGSNVIIGLVPAIEALAFALPQLFGARYYERIPHKVFYMWRVNVSGRLLFAVYGAMVIFWAADHPGIMLVAFFLFLGFLRGGIGFQAPAFSDVLAKVVSVHRRSRFIAITFTVGGAVGAVAAAVVARILGQDAFPVGFGFVFLFAGLYLATINTFMLLLKEPPSEVRREPSEPLHRVVSRVPTVLRNDPAFLRYVIGRTLIGWGLLGMSFFAVYAVRDFGATPTDVGIYTAVLLASQTVATLFWGYLADRVTSTIVPTLGGLLGVAAIALVLAAPGPGVFVIAFVLVGAGYGAVRFSDFAVLINIAPRDQISNYAAVFAVSTSPLLVPAALLAGFVADAGGYVPMFVGMLMLIIAGTVFMIFSTLRYAGVGDPA